MRRKMNRSEDDDKDGIKRQKVCASDGVRKPMGEWKEDRRE